MLVNIPRYLLLFLPIALFAIVVTIVISGAIWGILKDRKSGAWNRTKMLLFSMLALLIAAAAWIYNMGWIHLIMTFLGIPFIHAIIFVLNNLFVSSYTDESRTLKLQNRMFIITYLLLYLFLVDGGDVGGLYCFFGLLHNEWLIGIAQGIFHFALLAHIAEFVIQIVLIARIKKKWSVNTAA